MTDFSVEAFSFVQTGDMRSGSPNPYSGLILLGIRHPGICNCHHVTILIKTHTHTHTYYDAFIKLMEVLIYWYCAQQLKSFHPHHVSMISSKYRKDKNLTSASCEK